jgi:hypothetical protein
MKWILNDKTNPKDKATLFEEVHVVGPAGQYDAATGFVLIEIERYDPVSEEWYTQTVPVWRLTTQEDD